MGSGGGAETEWQHRFRPALHGRAELTEHLRTLIERAEQRLLTLSGDGGVGKSHVAAVVARDVARSGRRVAVADLTGVDDPARALDRCAEALGRRAPGGDTTSWIAETLDDEPALLVVDGADHAAALATPLADLVVACPTLVVLVTSRAALSARGERVVKVGPLPVVEVDTTPRRAELAHAPAVALFVDRSEAAGRSVRSSDLPLIAAICNALEGWPLAIELVAARTEVPLPGLLDQLRRGGVGSILSMRSSGGPARHSSIAQTVAWSVQLLRESQRHMLRVLGVLQSWTTFDEAVELAITLGHSRGEAIDDIDTLLRLHLLVTDDSPVVTALRVRPLIRDALELRPSPELLEGVDRQLVGFADTTLVAERSSGPIVWVRELARREADLEAALERALARGDGDAVAVLADALATLWVRSGRHDVGARTFRRCSVATWQRPMSPHRAAVTAAWTLLFRILCTPSQSRRQDLGRGFDSIVDHAVASGDDGAIFTVCELSVEAGRRCHHYESIARHCRIAHDRAIDAGALRTAAAHATWMAMALHMTGDLEAAVRTGFEALTTARAAESPTLAAYASMLLAQLPHDVVSRYGPVPTIEHAVELAELADDPYVLADVLPAAATAALVRGDMTRALTHVRSAIEIVRTDALHEQGLTALLVSTGMAVTREDDAVAALLGGAVADQLPMIREVIGAPLVEVHLAGLRRARKRLGPPDFDRHAARGAALGWREVYRLAAEAVTAWADRDAVERPGATLTGREREVLHLLAAGMSNKQIGRELGITAKTTTHHTTAIYRKLGVRTRAEAVNTAFRHGLLTDA